MADIMLIFEKYALGLMSIVTVLTAHLSHIYIVFVLNEQLCKHMTVNS